MHLNAGALTRLVLRNRHDLDQGRVRSDSDHNIEFAFDIEVFATYVGGINYHAVVTERQRAGLGTGSTKSITFVKWTGGDIDIRASASVDTSDSRRWCW